MHECENGMKNNNLLLFENQKQHVNNDSKIHIINLTLATQTTIIVMTMLIMHVHHLNRYHPRTEKQ